MLILREIETLSSENTGPNLNTKFVIWTLTNDLKAPSFSFLNWKIEKIFTTQDSWGYYMENHEE